MITVNINENTAGGQKILKQLANNPEIGNYKNPNIPRDEKGNIIGHSFDVFKEKMKSKFKEHYGVEYDSL